jgi:hypothetical protein
LAGAKVIHAADKRCAIVGTIVPHNLIGCRPLLKPGTLLPVPGRRFSDLGPFEVIVQMKVPTSARSVVSIG